MKKLILVLVLLFFSFCFPQQNNIYFTQTDIAEGLPGNHPYKIIEDRFGYLWITAETGLFRYNGYEYENFLPDPKNPHSFKGEIGYDVCEGARGRIWVLSNSSLQYYDYDIGGFVEYKSLRDSVKGFTNWGEFAANKDSSIYISFNKWGLFKIDKQGKYTKFLSDSAKGPVLKDPSGNIAIDKFNRLWIMQPHSIAVYNNEKKSISYIPVFDSNSKNTEIDMTKGYFSARFYKYHDKEFWFASPDNRIFTANIDTNIIVIEYKLNNTLSEILKGVPISSLNIDRDKFLWISTAGRDIGLFVVSLKDGSFKQFESDYGVEGKLSSNSIGSIFEDRSGTVWLTTGRSGMTRWDPFANKFTKIFDAPQNHIDGPVYNFFPLSDGNLLVTDLHGNIFKVNPNNETILFKNTIRNGNSDPNNNRVYFAEEWKDNLALIRPRNGSFYTYSLSNNTLNKLDVSSPDKIPESMRLPIVGKNGNIWLAGSYNGRTAISSYNLTSGKLNIFFPVPPNEEGSFTAFNYTYSVMQDRFGSIWTGTNGRGFYRFDPGTKTFMKIDNPLLTTVIASIEGSDGNIWAGSDKGLFIITPEGKVIKMFTSKDGLLHEMILSLAEDNIKNMWVQTKRGLSCINMNDFSIRNLGEKDGFPIKSSNHNFKKLINGDIAFTSDDKILKISPGNILDNKIPPVISINHLEISGQEITPSNSDVLDHYIGSTKKIELAYNQNDIDLSYIGIHYSRSERINYSYFLKGYDSGWRNVGHSRSARYTNLSPGQYVFLVKAQNADGYWNVNPAQLIIVIHPPLWQTWWAYLSYIVLFIGALVIIRDTEIKRRKKKEEQKLLEAENKRKSEELEEARQLQLSMLPKEIPLLPHLTIAVYMKTATEVGGDYYDFYVGLDGTLTVAIGDATGHGMQAGTIVSMTKALFTSTSSKLDMKTYFNQSSDALKEIELGRLMMAFMMIKIYNHNLEICNAGMPPLFVFRKQSKQVEEIMLKGMPLGAIKNFPYEIIKTDLSSGDTILLLSDGLPELKNDNNKQFGYERVKDSFRQAAEKQPEEIINHLKEEGSRWANDKDPDDDVTFVVIKVK